MIRFALLMAFTLFSAFAWSQCTCTCSNPGDQDAYIAAIREKLRRSNACTGCEPKADETLLVYDAKCKKFLSGGPGGSLSLLNDIRELRLPYKKAFRIKLVNFNRYLYNLNIGNSDIAYTSTPSPVMQQYLIPGTNTPITIPNTFTTAGSQNGGSYVFASIAGLKGTIDVILSNINTLVLPIHTADDLDKKLNILIGPLNKLPPGDTAKDNALRLGTEIGRINYLSSQGRTDTLAANRVDSMHQFILSTQTAFNAFFENKTDRQIKDSLKVSKDSILRQLKRVSDIQTIDSLLVQSKTEYFSTSRSIINKIKDLGKYCDSFVDARIRAYSDCTLDTLPCCKPENMGTYLRFDTLLNDISKEIYYMKYWKSRLDTLTDRNKANAPIAGKPTDPPKKAPSLTVAISELTIKDGKISSVKLEPAPAEPEKPRAVSIKDPFALIDSLWFAFEKSIPADYIMRQILFMNNLTSATTSYTSPPIFPYGDHMGLVLQITPSDSVVRMGTMPVYSETLSLDFIVTGRPMFSFSAGTFAGAWMRSDTYDWQQIPPLGSNTVQPNAPYRLARTSKGNIPMGFVGLANVTWPWPMGTTKTSKWLQNNIRLGLSGGVGAVVDPTPVRVGYMLGGAISVGTYQQFHVSFGAMAMPVNELKDGLSGATLYSSKPSMDLYNQRMKLGAFVAVSYTVFSPKSSANQATVANNTTTGK